MASTQNYKNEKISWKHFQGNFTGRKEKENMIYWDIKTNISETIFHIYFKDFLPQSHTDVTCH